MTRRRRGFTLLELTIATLIMAMIALTLYSCLRTAFRARTQAIDQVRGPRQASIVLDLLAADFQSIVKPGSALGGAFTGYAMGSPSAPADSVSFVCLGKDDELTQQANGVVDNIDTPALEGPRGVTFLLRSDSGSSRLVRQVQRHLLATALPEVEEETIADGVRGFSVRYYGDEGWVSEWDSDTTGGLPLAVELTVQLDVPLNGDPDHVYQASKLIPLAVGGIPAAATATAGVTP